MDSSVCEDRGDFLFNMERYTENELRVLLKYAKFKLKPRMGKLVPDYFELWKKYFPNDSGDDEQFKHDMSKYEDTFVLFVKSGIGGEYFILDDYNWIIPEMCIEWLQDKKK